VHSVLAVVPVAAYHDGRHVRYGRLEGLEEEVVVPEKQLLLLLREARLRPL